MVESLNDPPSRLAVDCERAIVQALDGDCHSPIAALATIQDEQLTLRAAVAGRDGKPPLIRAADSKPPIDASACVRQVVDQLIQLGAGVILRGNG